MQSFLTLQVVIVGVLRHSSVQERPGQIIHSILFVFYSLGDNFSIEVVMHAVIQVRFHRQRLIQELLKEILAKNSYLIARKYVKGQGIYKGLAELNESKHKELQTCYPNKVQKSKNR